MTFLPRKDKVFRRSPEGQSRIWARVWQVTFSIFCAVTLIWGLTSCGHNRPPRALAPGGSVIEQAIAFTLHQHYQRLSHHIIAPVPTPESKHIEVRQIDSFYLDGLPVYHLQGYYDLLLTLPSQHSETLRHKGFDLYLQRQQQGQTWRCLQKQASGWQSQSLLLKP